MEKTDVSSITYFFQSNKDNGAVLGPVVRRPISANPGLNFSLGLFIPLLKILFGVVFNVIFKASNRHILDKKNLTEFSFKAFRSEIRFHSNPRAWFVPCKRKMGSVIGLSIYYNGVGVLRGQRHVSGKN